MDVQNILLTVTGAVGTSGIVGLLFSRKLQKAKTESVIVEASGKFVQDVSDQMDRMDERMKFYEQAEQKCRQELGALQLEVVVLRQRIRELEAK